jgi:hypothetical protein
MNCVHNTGTAAAATAAYVYREEILDALNKAVTKVNEARKKIQDYLYNAAKSEGSGKPANVSMLETFLWRLAKFISLEQLLEKLPEWLLYLSNEAFPELVASTIEEFIEKFNKAFGLNCRTLQDVLDRIGPILNGVLVFSAAVLAIVAITVAVYDLQEAASFCERHDARLCLIETSIARASESARRLNADLQGLIHSPDLYTKEVQAKVLAKLMEVEAIKEDVVGILQRMEEIDVNALKKEAQERKEAAEQRTAGFMAGAAVSMGLAYFDPVGGIARAAPILASGLAVAAGVHMLASLSLLVNGCNS